MMFVGYPPNRESDSVRMWNPSTNRVMVTRDVIWLKRMFYEPENTIVMELDPVGMAEDATDEHSITNDTSNNDNYANDDDSTLNRRVCFVDDLDSDESLASAEREGIIPSATVILSGCMSKPPERLIKAMNLLLEILSIPGTKTEIGYLSRLQSLGKEAINKSFKLGLMEASIGGTEGSNDIVVWNTEIKLGIELDLVRAGIGKIMNFHDAMKSKDSDKWLIEVEKEKQRFDKYNVVTIVERKSLPSNAKVLSTTWAMKQKANGELHSG